MKTFGTAGPGKGKSLRAMLKELGEPDEKLLNDERYVEGYSDGYAAAIENHRQLSAALAAVYRIDREII
jgi:hypothetical protein